MADQHLMRPRDEEPIHLEEDESPLGGQATGTHTEMKAFGGGGHGLGVKAGGQFKRTLNVNGQGATRCRVFHSKIAPPSLEFMENQINQWVDGEQIEIKQVSQVIGIMEGKTPVPNLIVMVWY
jgi:hypothetical protein